MWSFLHLSFAMSVAHVCNTAVERRTAASCRVVLPGNSHDLIDAVEGCASRNHQLHKLSSNVSA